MTRSLSIASPVLALAVGCNLVAAPTASPIATIEPISPSTTAPPATVILTPAPTDTAPTPTALETPAPDVPTEPPTESPTESPSSAVWQRVSGFPPPGAHISGAVSGGPGFVAVGYEILGSNLCARSVDGIVWTSSDGNQWVESRPEALAGLALTRLVNAAGAVYAFGSVGHSDCESEYVTAIAKSLDGVAWARLEPDLPEGVFISAVGTAGNALIALGEYETQDSYEFAAWTSGDGVHWDNSVNAPRSFSWFADIVSLGPSAVALEGLGGRPVWYSDDAGASWLQSQFGPLYLLEVADATAGGGRIVAVGNACCSVPHDFAGVTIASQDGVTWQESAAFRAVPFAVEPIPGGFLAIGRTNWVSADGLDWRVGPGLPGRDVSDEIVAVSGEPGVIVIDDDTAWFAPFYALDVEEWTEPPRLAEMPELGVRYPAELFMHCGFPEVRFGLRTWVADPPFEDNFNTPPGFRELDRGWLTQLRDDELLYESRGGRTVTLVPGEPVNFGFCA
jgi:hypothetical protein